MKVFKYCLLGLGLTLLILSSCGGDKTPQEEKAFDDVMDIVKDLPETLKEAEEFVEEIDTDQFTGDFTLKSDQDDISINSWLARRSTVTFMDGNFSLRSCSNSDCDDKFMMSVNSPNLFTEELPLKLTASIFDKTNCTFMYTAKDKTDYIANEGEFTLNTLTDNSFSIDFNGKLMRGSGGDAVLIDATIHMNFEFNFISTDIRTK